MFQISGYHDVYVLPEDTEAVLRVANELLSTHVETWVVGSAALVEGLADVIAGTAPAAPFHVFANETGGALPTEVVSQFSLVRDAVGRPRVELLVSSDDAVLETTPHTEGIATGFGDVLLVSGTSALALKVKSPEVFGVFVAGFEALRSATAVPSPPQPVEPSVGPTSGPAGLAPAPTQPARDPDAAEDTAPAKAGA